MGPAVSFYDFRNSIRTEIKWSEMIDLLVGLSSCTIDYRAPVARTALSSPSTRHAISSISVCNVRSNSDSRPSVPDALCLHTKLPILWPCLPDLRAEIEKNITNICCIAMFEAVRRTFIETHAFRRLLVVTRRCWNWCAGTCRVIDRLLSIHHFAHRLLLLVFGDNRRRL